MVPPPDAFAGDPVFDLHRGGKTAVTATVPLEGRDDLSMAYTPGVARVCTAIADRPDIGPAPSLPVMEGTAILFKRFGGVDAAGLTQGRR